MILNLQGKFLKSADSGCILRNDNKTGFGMETMLVMSEFFVILDPHQVSHLNWDDFLYDNIERECAQLQALAI